MPTHSQELLNNLTAAGSMPEIRRRFAEFLGLEEPLPDLVIHRALAERPFLHHLIICRGSPRFLQILIQDPKNAQYSHPPATVTETTTSSTPLSDDAVDRDASGNWRLVAKAAGALARWGAAGIARVEPEVFERRWSACLACPHLVSPPELMVYKLSGALSARQTDRRVCSACGCVAQRKAKLPTEHCPRPDPAQSGLNRWGEALSSRRGDVMSVAEDTQGSSQS